MSIVSWNGDKANEFVRRQTVMAVKRVCIEIVRKAKYLLSVPGPTPSSPGEPPHKQTGQLRMSVAYEVDERSEPIQARVGTNMIYGMFLELGTRRGISPRPWLRRAAYETQERVGTDDSD